MQTIGMLYRLTCMSLGVERGCYIVVMKSSLGEVNLIIYNLVISFQIHTVHKINNVRVSLGIKKQMAPPPENWLPLSISWKVSYITAQINEFRACSHEKGPS